MLFDTLCFVLCQFHSDMKFNGSDAATARSSCILECVAAAEPIAHSDTALTVVCSKFCTATSSVSLCDAGLIQHD